jgi:hypothetical protein
MVEAADDFINVSGQRELIPATVSELMLTVRLLEELSDLAQVRRI